MTTYRERLTAFLQCSCMHPRSFKWCYTNKSAKQMPLARTHVSRENTTVLRENANIFARERKGFARERKYLCERTQHFLARERKYLCERTQRFCEGTQSFSRERKTLENIFSSYPEFFPPPCPLKGSVVINLTQKNIYLNSHYTLLTLNKAHNHYQSLNLSYFVWYYCRDVTEKKHLFFLSRIPCCLLARVAGG